MEINKNKKYRDDTVQSEKAREWKMIGFFEIVLFSIVTSIIYDILIQAVIIWVSVYRSR